MPTVGLISLGCSRNLVDSETILGSLKKAGFEIIGSNDRVDICIINTCAFIEDARKESIDTIMEAVSLKREGKIKHLVICGCLSQLYKGQLVKNLPEADLFIGTSDLPNIAHLVERLRDGRRDSKVSSTLRYIYDENSPRFSLTPKHYRYVKISEGCSNLCSYCIIPRLRGSFRSRSIKSVVDEVRDISNDAALKEIDLVGQDTTLFGFDRYGKTVFSRLLKDICKIKNNIGWIRILYTHPAHYNGELIDVIRAEGKICKYLDLPIQHASDSVLKRMNRRTTKKEIAHLIDRLRRNIPGLVLRTSIIIGFPGETGRDFKELLEFIGMVGFEHLGAFVYSKEDGTRASRLNGQVPDELKKERLNELMKFQRKISSRRLNSFLGKTVEVLIDEKLKDEKDKFLGRTQGDAPEVDGGVYVSGEDLKAGDFCRVRITDTLEYDLVGEAV